MDLISVIVPVYNVEKYLDKCIESITNQTYRNLEIILVDDGSLDMCPQICDEWAKRDSRIKVIHQDNAGGGAARNKGLEIATGNYISFIDSDDYIESHMYEVLLEYFDEDIDIVECDIAVSYDDNAALDGNILNSRVETHCVVDALKMHIQDKLFCQTPPNKLYRRTVIDNILFPVGKRIDDEFWTYKVIGRSHKLVHVYLPMYAYRQQEGSVMHKSFSLERLQALDAKCQRLEYIKKYYPELEDEAQINMWYTCLFLGQMSLIYLSKDDCENAFKKIRDLWKINNDNNFVSFKGVPLKDKIWAYISNITFKGVCKVRNSLKIGL